MSKRAAIAKTAPRTMALGWTVAQIATIWIAADVAYYYLLPVLGLKPDYNSGSIAITLLYVFWVGIAVIAFWPLYARWPRYAKWTTFENRLGSIVLWSLAFVGTVVFAAYILPLLPPLTPLEGVKPPDLPRATPWYFLPKSIEILFQQLLVVALVLALAAEKYSLRRISFLCGALFGGAHLLLAFGDVPWGYVARFATLATVFGLGFPYFILRVPNGFAYSYMLHWGFYAATVIMARALGPGVLPNLLKHLYGATQ